VVDFTGMDVYGLLTIWLGPAFKLVAGCIGVIGACMSVGVLETIVEETGVAMKKFEPPGAGAAEYATVGFT
jgi:hypothetical protein